VYLCFVVFDDRQQMDVENVKVILEWPTPCSVIKVRSFHVIANFSRSL
jgi:hypothetical protein